MCDLDEAVWAEYLRYRETSRARVARTAEAGEDPARSLCSRPVAPEPVEA